MERKKFKKRFKMNTRSILSFIMLFALCLSAVWNISWADCRAQEKIMDESHKSIKVKPSDLYARSAVLMDAETGRILFGKNKDEQMPMASTTKIMTCILALENGNLSDKAEVSSVASVQPKVKLGMTQGQTFYLKDLLYSLMLESHNDSAVAIAECIAGNVDKFADMMNKKASQLGCNSTYFITPNGLDGQDENGIHHTTAEELARIMRYCIMESPQKEKFLEITRADAYTFTDCKGEKSYSCVNHNTFLKMMDGALSGKTGFTQDAGYCYVGALRKDGKTLIVALLACGWPNNKGYKWSDTKKLMTYGMENYCYKEISPDKIDRTEKIYIKNGYTGGFPKKGKDLLEVEISGESKKILVGADDKDEIEIKIKKEICAPIKKGTVIGEIVYRVNGERIISYEVVAGKTVKERTLWICAEYLRRKFLL